MVLTFSWQFNQWCGPWFLSIGSLGFLRPWQPHSKSKHSMKILWNCVVFLDFDKKTAEHHICQTQRTKTPRPYLSIGKISVTLEKSRIGDTKYCRYFWKILSVKIFIIRMEINLRPLDKKKRDTLLSLRIRRK